VEYLRQKHVLLSQIEIIVFPKSSGCEGHGLDNAEQRSGARAKIILTGQKKQKQPKPRSRLKRCNVPHL